MGKFIDNFGSQESSEKLWTQAEAFLISPCQYDALGRQTGVKQPRHENYSTISYNPKGQVIATTDATGTSTTYVYYNNGVPGAGQLRQEYWGALPFNEFGAWGVRYFQTFDWE